MSAYTDALEEAERNAFCDITRAGVAGGILFAGLTAATAAGALGGLAVSALSAHLYATYCGRPLPPQGRPRRPFNGGQCALRYYVRVAAIATDSRTGLTHEVAGGGWVRGPLIRVELFVDENQFNTAIAIVDGSSDDDVYTVVSPGLTDNGVDPRFTFDNFTTSIVPENGLPDNCGDPPLVPPFSPPGDRFDAPGNIIYVTPEGDTINVPVTFDFRGARIGINPDFHIPVNVRFDLDPTLNIGGTVNFNTGDFVVNPYSPGTPPGGGDTPRDVFTPPGNPPGTPPGTPPPNPPGVPDEDAPPRDPDPLPEPAVIIRGVIVQVFQAETDATIIFQDAAPDIYAPNLGYITFKCLVDDYACWTTDIPVKNRSQLIECPWRYGAVDVRGNPKGGATFNLIPVYDVDSRVVEDFGNAP
jgi:hypothetical protein